MTENQGKFTSVNTQTIETKNLNPVVENETTTDKSNIINNTLKEELLKQKTVYVAARTSKLPRGMAEKILESAREEFKLNSRDEALAVIAILLQQGGTARSCDGNMSITLFEKEFKLADLRRILKRNSCAKAERKLAKTIANEIREISLIMEIPGNLYLKIKKTNIEKEFTIEEQVWLSDFQADNDQCPTELRKLIVETFKNPETSNKNKKKKKKIE